MPKLCIIGNSHVASLKQGWDQIRDTWPQVQVDFLAQAGNEGLQSVIAVDGWLTSENEAMRRAFVATYGRDRLRIADHDVFLIYGARSRTYWPNGTFYSEACLDAAIADLTRGTPAQHVLEALREFTDAPIHVGHTPLLAARIARDRSVSPAYAEGIDLLNRRHYRRFGAEMIGQPPATIVNGRSTAPEYSWGVKTLAMILGEAEARVNAGDNSHMDAAFGALWLEAYFAATLAA